MRAPAGRPGGRRRVGWPAARLACLLALLAGAALAQTPTGYYPDADGMSWTYSSGETQQLSGPREVDGQQVMVLTHYFQGVPVSEDYLQYGDDVVSVGTASGGAVVPYDPPLVIYAAGPLQAGQQWKSTTQLSDFSITLSAEVLGVRGVRTAAGRFNALQIRQRTLTSNGGSTVLDLFFVPGVGVVRFVTGDGTTIDLIEKNF